MIRSLSQISLKYLGIFFLQVILGAVIFIYGYQIINNSYNKSDFRAFYSAATIVRQQPQNLYKFDTQAQYETKLFPQDPDFSSDRALLYANLPPYLFLFIPLTYLTLSTAYFISILFQLVLLSVTLYLSFKIFKPTVNQSLLLLTFLSFAPLYLNVYLIQSGISTLLLFSLSYYFLIQKKDFMSGFTSSLLLLKPQMGLIIWLYYLWMRNKKIWAGILSGWLVILILSWILTKGHLWEIISIYGYFMDSNSITWTNRISWLGFFAQLKSIWAFLNIKNLSLVFNLITIIVSWLVTKNIKFKENSLPIIFGIIITLTLLTGLHVNSYEAVLLIFVMFSAYSKQHSWKLHLIVLFGWIIYFASAFSINQPKDLYFLPTIYLLLILIIQIYSLKQLNKIYP